MICIYNICILYVCLRCLLDQFLINLLDMLALLMEHLFPACRKRQTIKLGKKRQTAQQSMTMFFHQQLCSPGMLIWQCVTWTRSFRCLRPNTLLSSPHRLKVSPIGTHKLSMYSFSCCLETMSLWFLSRGSAGILCVRGAFEHLCPSSVEPQSSAST